MGTSTKKHSDLLKHMSYLNLWQRHQGTDELVAVEDDGVKKLGADDCLILSLCDFRFSFYFSFSHYTFPVKRRHALRHQLTQTRLFCLFKWNYLIELYFVRANKV